MCFKQNGSTSFLEFHILHIFQQGQAIQPTGDFQDVKSLHGTCGISPGVPSSSNDMVSRRFLSSQFGEIFPESIDKYMDVKRQQFISINNLQEKMLFLIPLFSHTTTKKSPLCLLPQAPWYLHSPPNGSGITQASKHTFNGYFDLWSTSHLAVSWWFQPIYWIISPGIGVKVINIWNHLAMQKLIPPKNQTFFWKINWRLWSLPSIFGKKKIPSGKKTWQWNPHSQ